MQTSTTTCNLVGSSTECITVSLGFSYGEIAIFFILIIFFTTFFFDVLKNWLLGTKLDGSIKIKYDK
jgi:hypothetical protein